MTIKKKIEILKAESNNLYELALIFENEGNIEKYHYYLSKHIEIDHCIDILTDNKFATEMAKIYEVEV